MRMTKLGADGPEVSQFGIGAMSLAGIYGDATIEQSFAVLDACRSSGVTHIDTANVYGDGRSEEMIGSWFSARPGVRSEMVLATKAGITRDPDRRFNNDSAFLEASLDRSLQRLGVDHVDLFYAHRYDRIHSPEDVAGALYRLVEKGKARAVGLSEVAPGTLRRAASECTIAAVQSEYSLSTRAPELGLAQTCAELGAALVAFSPVGRAYLTDQPFNWERVQSMAFTKTNPRFIEPNYSANISKTDEFRALAADMGEPAAAVAIAWLISRGNHILPIPGTKSTAHLAELVRGTELALASEDLKRIDRVLPVGWAYGDRYNASQWEGPERYC